MRNTRSGTVADGCDSTAGAGVRMESNLYWIRVERASVVVVRGDLDADVGVEPRGVVRPSIQGRIAQGEDDSVGLQRAEV